MCLKPTKMQEATPSQILGGTPILQSGSRRPFFLGALCFARRAENLMRVSLAKAVPCSSGATDSAAIFRDALSSGRRSDSIGERDCDGQARMALHSNGAVDLSNQGSHKAVAEGSLPNR